MKWTDVTEVFRDVLDAYMDRRLDLGTAAEVVEDLRAAGITVEATPSK